MFGKLGDMASLIKNYGEIQSRIKQMKDELAELKVEGTGAGGLVKVVVLGDLSRVDSVEIDPRCCDARNQTALQGAVREAVTNALENVRLEGAKRLREATGGLDIPGLNG